MNIERIKNLLSKNNIKLVKGLTEKEIHYLELKYEIIFPNDYKSLLKSILPIGKGFINWREDPEKQIYKSLNWPLEGVLFDVKNNNYWNTCFGSKADSFKKNERMVREFFTKIPKMIPIYGHRYIPSLCEESLPIFSIHQTDIIYYGANLENYFEVEFKEKEYSSIFSHQIKKVNFWSNISS